MEKLGILWGIIVFVFIILFNSVTKISTGYVGVSSTFGKYNMEELQPGLNFIKPFITTVYKVDTKIQNITYKGNGNIKDNDDNGNDSIMYKPAITVLDNRWLPIEIELSVLYKVIPEFAAETLAKYGLNYRNKIINPLIRESVRDIVWQYDAETLPSKRTEIASKIKAEIEKKVKELKYFEISDVQLRNIELPQQIQAKILQVQAAKQEASRQKYLLEKAKIEAETKKAQAKWEADAKIEQAKGKAESIRLEAEAQAQANKKLSGSITKELVEYQKVQKWNGNLPQYVWNSNWMILNMK